MSPPEIPQNYSKRDLYKKILLFLKGFFILQTILTHKFNICKIFWFNILNFLKLFFSVQQRFLPTNAPIKKMAGMYTKKLDAPNGFLKADLK